jgi:hypothetical protein
MKHLTRSRLACAIVAILGLVVVQSPRLFAQSTTDGAIGGVVSDSTGASLPGATVTARNIATNSSAEATTDATGRFAIIRLQPGVYNVEVTLPGFGTQKRDNTIVEVGRTTSLEVTLGVGTQTETVVVVGQSPIINTDQSDFSTNINQTTIANLPTNTRRWSTFALMTGAARTTSAWSASADLGS